MRIALVSPYSWTYPGGVTRHIEALSAELAAQGHEPRILAPFDPDDALSARLHRGARPQRCEPPPNFVPLGRTIGIPANGAVSNLTGTPHSVFAIRQALRTGGYDIAHIHEPVVPLIGWDALMSVEGLPLVGTFHTYSSNPISNGIGAVVLGGRRRMNRLHVRIAVSEAAAWTARRFYGGHYRIVPNGVRLPHMGTPHGRGQAGCGAVEADGPAGLEELGELHAKMGAPRARVGEAFGNTHNDGQALRILFIGQAVERKGLPVLLRAFEALREHVPATLTLVGASAEEIAPMLLDDRGVRALGKVSEEDKHAELRRADVLCAPSLRGESFGMVLTEAFAASTPVVASDIPGYRDVARDQVDGLLVPPGDALALAESLRALALDPARRAAMATAARERAERFSWAHVAEEVADCYEQAVAVAQPATRTARIAVRHGFAPADLRPRERARRLPSLEPAPPTHRRALRILSRAALLLSSLAGLALAFLALQRIGVTQVAASLVASSPGLVAAGVGVMCASMFVRGIAWHAILKAAPTWRVARRRDALQGTFIGVLMSATLPARLGEPSRALIVARRLGRARETLPVVLGTMVSQTLLNLLALAILGGVMFFERELRRQSHERPARGGAGPARGPHGVAARTGTRAARGPLALATAGAAAHERARRARARASGAERLSQPSPGVVRDPASTLRLGASVALLLAPAAGARARREGGPRRRRGRPVRCQRHRGHPRHARQRGCLPGGVRRRLGRRLPRPHGRRACLWHRPAGRRGRHRRHHGNARSCQ